MMAMTRAVKIALCGSEGSESIAARQDRGLPLYNFLTDVQDILNPPEYHWCYRDLSCDASTWPAHYAGKVSTKFRGSCVFTIFVAVFSQSLLASVPILYGLE